MTVGEAIALTRWTFVGKVISLLSNTLSRFIIALLPRSKRVLISWLQSLSTLFLESKKIISNLNLRGSNNLSDIFPFSYQQRFSALIGVDVSVQKNSTPFFFSKIRNITLTTKVHLVKAMAFPVVTYGCESWTIKKAERQRIDAFELWWLEDS